MPVTTTLTEEITTTSLIGRDEAVRQAISLATAQVGEVERLEVKQVEVLIESGNVAGYRVTLEVTHSGEHLQTDEGGEGSIRVWSRSYPPATPLRVDEEGTIRVGGTRVTLDSVLAAFREGETADGIAQRYPTLRRGDVQLVLDYYLSHQDELGAYVAEREREATRLREELEADLDPAGLRARLLARRVDRR